MEEENERQRSWAWFLLPVFVGIVGGAIAYFALRRDELRMAKDCLYIGIASSIPIVVVSVAGGLGLALWGADVGDSVMAADIDGCLADSEAFDGSLDLDAFNECVREARADKMP